MFETVKANIGIHHEPESIGDVLFLNDTAYCIIGIESIVFKNKKAYQVLYTVQKISSDLPESPSIRSDERFESKLVKIIRTVPFESLEKQDPFSIPNMLLEINIGRVIHRKGASYRVERYTQIERTETSIKIHLLAKPLTPMSLAETKTKHLEARKKRLNLTIV